MLLSPMQSILLIPVQNLNSSSSNSNIYFIGDCSGMGRGLTTACSQGILCAEDLLKTIDN